MARAVTTSIGNWVFQKQHVQQNIVGGDFVGSHSCLLCATGPRLSDLTKGMASIPDGSKDTVQGVNSVTGEVTQPGDVDETFAIPIGVIDTASLQQDRQIAQIFEIGSKRSYILASRTVGVLNIARVFYKGPNLLRMLYSYYPQAKIDANSGGTTNTLMDNNAHSSTAHAASPIGIDKDMSAELQDIRDLPGFNNVWFNLNSDIFSYPYGMVLYIQDNNNNDVAAVFLEECYIQNHQFNMSANQIIVAENITMRFERIVPIKVNVINKDLSNSSSNGSTPGWSPV